MAWIKLNATTPAAPEDAENVHFRQEAGHEGTQSDPNPVSAFTYPIPPGGDEGDVLTKQSGDDHDAGWAPAAGGILTGPFSSRPAAGSLGRIFIPTDLPVAHPDFYFDSGSIWIAYINFRPVVGGGAGGAGGAGGPAYFGLQSVLIG
jgi:hypothetical protein